MKSYEFGPKKIEPIHYMYHYLLAITEGKELKTRDGLFIASFKINSSETYFKFKQHVSEEHDIENVSIWSLTYLGVTTDAIPK